MIDYGTSHSPKAWLVRSYLLDMAERSRFSFLRSWKYKISKLPQQATDTPIQLGEWIINNLLCVNEDIKFSTQIFLPGQRDVETYTHPEVLAYKVRYGNGPVECSASDVACFAYWALKVMEADGLEVSNIRFITLVSKHFVFLSKNSWTHWSGETICVFEFKDGVGMYSRFGYTWADSLEACVRTVESMNQTEYDMVDTDYPFEGC